jgi:hypothetical protein
MSKAVLLAALVVAAVAVATAGTASATVVQCKTKVYSANSPIFVTSASGISCAAAAKEQRRVKWTGKNTFRTPSGYRCKPSGRGKVGYQIRCVLQSETHAPWAYRIEFAD